MKRCEEQAIRGTGVGTCDQVLDANGRCPNWRKHVAELDPRELERLERKRNG